MNKQNNNQSGQIIVVLLLIVVVVLAIGLSVVGRSNTEVITASKIENSARAFSAAEAGIEHAIASNLTTQYTFPAGSFLNSSSGKVAGTIFPSLSVPIIEQQNIGGTESTSFTFAQFWFADPSTASYHQSAMNDSFDLYFGDPTITDIDERPAVEMHIIYETISGPVTTYKDVKYYFDSARGQRGSKALTVDANVSGPIGGCDIKPPYPSSGITTEFGNDRPFYCQVHVAKPELAGGIGVNFPWSPSNNNSFPLLARIRILYSSKGQNVAIGPPISNPTALLPPQINVYSSTGTSGDSQRTVQVTRDTNVMPYLFDFALYTDSGTTKQ